MKSGEPLFAGAFYDSGKPPGHAGTTIIPTAQRGRWLRKRTNHMPQGDKSSYTNKQKRQAGHIEKGYEKKGVSKKTAEKRAWATVNKETGGGRKSRAKAKA